MNGAIFPGRQEQNGETGPPGQRGKAVGQQRVSASKIGSPVCQTTACTQWMLLSEEISACHPVLLDTGGSCATHIPYAQQLYSEENGA